MIFKSTNIPCIVIKQVKKPEHIIIIKNSFTWAAGHATFHMSLYSILNLLSIFCFVLLNHH